MSVKPNDNGVANRAQEDQEQDSQDAGICASPDNMSEVSGEDEHGDERGGVGTDGSAIGADGQVTDSGEYGSEEEGVTDEEDEEDEDEEDDEEPALKYERLGGSVHDILVKDSASTLAYSHKRLVRLPS